MKNITKKSIKEDYELITNLAHKYSEAIWENQEAQPAHYDKQSKLVRIVMSDIRFALSVAMTALTKLNELEIIED